MYSVQNTMSPAICMRSEPTRLDTGILDGVSTELQDRLSDRMGLFTGDGVDAQAMYTVVL